MLDIDRRVGCNVYPTAEHPHVGDDFVSGPHGEYLPLEVLQNDLAIWGEGSLIAIVLLLRGVILLAFHRRFHRGVILLAISI